MKGTQMRKPAVAIVAVVLLLGGIAAQDAEAPGNVDVRSYGESGDVVLGRLSDDLGLKLHVTRAAQFAMLDPAWVVCEDVPGETATALLEESLGVEMETRHGVLFVTDINETLRGAETRGYDVSVLAGHHVEYVNAYSPPAAGEENQRTAAEQLGLVLDDVIARPGRDGPYASVVGDRVLYTMDAPRHARVRETLDLLMRDGGGESVNLVSERALFETLSTATYEGRSAGTPVGSVLARICAAAEVPLVLDAEFIRAYGDWHVDFEVDSPVSCARALHMLLAQVEDERVYLGSRGGALLVTLDPMQLHHSLKVVDVGVLLKKLEASYQRQRTTPGRTDGFEGDLSSNGGIGVVVNAIYEQLDAAGQVADVIPYGTRILIRGGHAQVDTTVRILKEMGWEPPEEH